MDDADTMYIKTKLTITLKSLNFLLQLYHRNLDLTHFLKVDPPFSEWFTK